MRKSHSRAGALLVALVLALAVTAVAFGTTSRGAQKADGGSITVWLALASLVMTFLVGLAVRHTTWQLWHFNNKTVIVLAPVDNEFIPAVHGFSPASLYFTIRLRTCLT